MYNIKRFEEWLDKLEESEIEDSLAAQAARVIWREAHNKASEEIQIGNIDPKRVTWADNYVYHELGPSNNFIRCSKKFTPIRVNDRYTPIRFIGEVNINGDIYKEDFSGYEYFNKRDTNLVEDSFDSYLRSFGLNRKFWAKVDGRDENWIRNTAAKNKQKLKEYIESKIAKFADGSPIAEIIENGYFDLILICENGTRIHLYAITAGGYNIQCLHTRILVKKLKS